MGSNLTVVRRSGFNHCFGMGVILHFIQIGLCNSVLGTTLTLYIQLLAFWRHYILLYLSHFSHTILYAYRGGEPKFYLVNDPKKARYMRS